MPGRFFQNRWLAKLVKLQFTSPQTKLLDLLMRNKERNTHILNEYIGPALPY